MSAGQPPFQGNSALAILKQIAEAKHQPLRELNPDAPEWLADLVDDLLAKKPEDRYKSAAELAEVLEYLWSLMRTSDDLPTVCHQELKSRARRTRWMFGVIGAALLGIGLVVGMLLPRFGGALPTATATSTARPAAVLAANSGSVWSIAFDPKSNTAAMAIEDGSVRLWDWPTKTVQATVDAHRGVVWSTRFFGDGKYIATAGDDGLLKIWDRTSLEPIKTFTHPNAVRSLEIGTNGKIYAGDRQGGLHVWSLDSDQPLVTAQQPGAVYAVAISRDSKTLATAGSGKIIRLWNADTLKQKLPLQGHEGPIFGLSFDQDGQHLASAGWDGIVRIWEVASGKLLHSWQGNDGDIWTIAYSSDGTKLATGGNDGAVKLWDPATGKQVAIYHDHKSVIHTLAFNDDGSLLASGGRDGTVRIWDLKSK